MRIEERIIGLEKGFNFRDMGGYATSDGRTVRRGILFRSAVMHEFTQSDIARVRGLDIACIYDLRSSSERVRRPTRWHEGTDTHLRLIDHDTDAGHFKSFMDNMSPALVVEKMYATYKVLPFQHAPNFAALFSHLLAGELPLVFHCASGKDRTGLAAALILHVLGVPFETIAADYELTDHFLEAMFDRIAENADLPKGETVSRELWLPALLCDPAYLATSFDAMTQQHGSVDAYLAAELGVDETARDRLRALLLE